MVKRAHFAEYKDSYKNYKFELSDEGILFMQCHTDGGPLHWEWSSHDAMADAFADIAGDREIKVVIHTGTGDTYNHSWGRPVTESGKPLYNAYNDLEGVATMDEKAWYGRMSSSMEEMQAFYDAIFPRVTEVIAYCDTFPLDNMTLETIPLSARTGTEIVADAAALLSGTHTAQIRDVLEQRGVVLFRRINLDDRQQVEFARTLGDVVDQGVDNIYKVTLDKTITATADYLLGTFHWHIDGTCDAIPTRAALLSARVLSETGGQTQWANTYAAYDDLPQDEKDAIDDLRVVHMTRRGFRSFEKKRGALLMISDRRSVRPAASISRCRPSIACRNSHCCCP